MVETRGSASTELHGETPAAPGRDAGTRAIRLAVIVNMVAPYTRPLFERLAQRDDCDLLVISETPMERDRHWEPERSLPFAHVLLDSWTLDLSRLAVGSGFRTRFDTYLYAPKRPLRPLVDFSADVVVAGGAGIWASPVNIAALAARRRRRWAFMPWWGSFTRPHPTWPRRLASPWVKHFFRASDACLVYGSRHALDLAEMGVDPARTIRAPITALAPERPASRSWPRIGAETRFLFIGRLIERKGLDVLIQAFAGVDGGELWIAGDGPLSGTVAAAAARDARIRILGHVSGEDLAALYTQVDVLLVPSLYEPWGLVVHEGLAHSLPVLATAQAMRDIATWTFEQRERAVLRSAETIERCSLDRSVAGFLRGAEIALEHRSTLRSTTSSPS
jgi:glycosyltransferase involved in cell wall biosynthesis